MVRDHTYSKKKKKKLGNASVSYTGLSLMARELSQDMVSVGGAHADLRESRQAVRRHIKLGAHLPGREFNLLAG